MANKGNATSPRSEVLLELQRLDVGSAVALVGHPIHVMLVHFPVAFVVATLGVGLLIAWLPLMVVGFWFIYRIAKGWLRLVDRRPLDV